MARRGGQRQGLRGRSHGFTVLELAIALTVVGLVAGVGMTALRPHGAWQAARACRAFLLWSRLEAVWSGRPVAVVPAVPAGLAARSGVGSSASEACMAEVTRRLRVSRFGRVEVANAFPTGIVWLPGGGARACRGGGVISGRMVLTDGADRVSVVVSSLGRVRVEAAP